MTYSRNDCNKRNNSYKKRVNPLNQSNYNNNKKEILMKAQRVANVNNNYMFLNYTIIENSVL